VDIAAAIPELLRLTKLDVRIPLLEATGCCPQR